MIMIMPHYEITIKCRFMACLRMAILEMPFDLNQLNADILISACNIEIFLVKCR